MSDEPEGYNCPFCNLIAGIETLLNKVDDIVYQDEFVTALISPHWWPNNPGHVLVIPNKHFRDLDDLEEKYNHRVADVIQLIFRAMKGAYGCPGVVTRQHNGKHGDQVVWHLHVHVIPRYEDDNQSSMGPMREYIPPEKRHEYAQKLRAYLKSALHV